jgi:hypothetical protein
MLYGLLKVTKFFLIGGSPRGILFATVDTKILLLRIAEFAFNSILRAGTITPLKSKFLLKSYYLVQINSYF